MLNEVADTNIVPTKAEAIEIALDIARADAMESGDVVLINVCQGGSKCPPGTSADGCKFCDVITCHPNGSVTRNIVGVH